MKTEQHPSARVSSKRRRGWVVALIVLGLITAAVAAALYAPHVVENTLEGEDVHDLVTRHTARELNMSAGFLPFESHGLQVTSGGLLCRSENPEKVEELRAHGITAESTLNQLKHKRWRVTQLSVQHLEAGFGGEAVARLAHPFEAPPPLRSPGPGDGTKWEAEIDKMHIDRTDILWGKEKSNFGGLWGAVTDTERVSEGVYRIQGREGMLRQTGWPDLAVKSFAGNYTDETLSIEETQLLLAGKDPVSITGEVRVGGKSGMHLTIKGDKCDVKPFLPEKMRSKLSGVFTTEAHLNRAESGEQGMATNVEGKLRFNSAIVSRIDGLNRVAKFTGIDRFRRLELDVLEGLFQWHEDELKVTDFVLESEGLLRVEGSFTLRGEKLRGNFRLGISESVLASFPGAKDQVFTQSKGPYYWAPLRVSGSLDDPQEDLKERLVAAAKAHYAKKFLAPILKPGKLIIEAIESLF